jgi:hypothetical protein
VRDASCVDVLTFAHRLTSGYGLVHMPFADFAPWLDQVPPAPSQVWSFTRPVNAADALDRLAPLSHPARRHLILPLATDWCAVVDNKRDGPDFADLQRYLERHCDAPTIRVIDQQGTTTIANGYRERMRWEAHIVEIRGPSTCRSIACANDGGRWIFETSGDPLPIESTFPYDARRKPDRFGTEQLADVLTYLGARPFQYGHPQCGPVPDA